MGDSPAPFTSAHQAVLPADPERIFTNFPQFPIEIRRQIWKHAAPNSRELYGSIVVITNFELSRPRAIITQPRQADYQPIGRATINPEEFDEFEEEHIELGENMENVTQSRTTVLSLLHTTRESRQITHEIFRLDCPSNVPEENELWWEEDDTLYFPIPADPRGVVLRWLSGLRPAPFHHFASIKHIALIYNHTLFPKDFASLEDQTNDSMYGHRWLQNFPTLSSVDLLFDPIKFAMLENGSLKLYEPYDVIVDAFNRTPSEMQERVTTRFEWMAQSAGLNREVPAVEYSVVCWKKPRDSS